MKKIEISGDFSAKRVNTKILSKSGNPLYYTINTSRKNGVVVEVWSTALSDHFIRKDVYNKKLNRFMDVAVPLKTVCHKPYGWSGTLVLNEASIGCHSVSADQSKFCEFTGADVSYGKLFDRYRANRVEEDSEQAISIQKMISITYNGLTYEVNEDADGFFYPPMLAVAVVYSEAYAGSETAIIKVAAAGKRGLSVINAEKEKIKSIIKDIRK